MDDKHKQDAAQLARDGGDPPTINQGGAANSGAGTTGTRGASKAARAIGDNAAGGGGAANAATDAPNVIDVGNDADMDFATALAQARERAKRLRERADDIDTSVRPSGMDWRSELDRVRGEYLESDDARAKRERQERARRKIAALTDGFTALSNMGGAMAGAAPIKQVSLSAAQKAQADKAKELRRRDKAAYEMAYRNIMARKEADDKARLADANRRGKLRDSLLKRADEMDGDILKAVADKTKHDAALRERGRHNRADEANDRMRASKSGGGAGKGGDRYYGTLDGKAYKTRADYDKAAQKAAKTYNVPTSTEDAIGNSKSRKTSEIAAEVEREKSKRNEKGQKKLNVRWKKARTTKQ